MAHEIATMAVNTTELAINIGNKIVQEDEQEATIDVQTALQPQLEETLEQAAALEETQQQRFATQTTLPEARTETDEDTFFTTDDFADRVFSGQPVQTEPSQEEFQAVQKRLNQNIINLEKVLAGLK